MKIINAKAPQALFALLAGLSILLMHQLGGGDAVSVTSPSTGSMTLHMHSNQAMSGMVASKAGATLAQREQNHGGGHEPASCASGHSPCQAIPAQGFVPPPISTATFVLAEPVLLLPRLRYSAARQERDPPERASLSVWRI